MQIFRRKPFMLCCFCFIVSFLISYCVIGKIKHVIAVCAFSFAILTAVTVVFLKNRALRIKLAVLLVALLMSGAAASEAYFYYDVYLSSLDKYAGKECRAELTLIEERYASVESSEYLARVESVNDESISGTVLVEFEGECGFGEGQKIMAYCEFLSLEEYSFNDRARMAYIADGLKGGFYVSAESDARVIDSSSKNNDIFLSLNRRLVRKLEELLDGEAGRLASALFLGRKDRLSDETVRDFGRVGLSHALALSGMHISILAGFIDIILRKTGLPKLLRCLTIPAIMLAYLALTGFSLSTVRAVIMLSAVCVSYIIASPIDKLTVLFASCAGIIAVFPSSLVDIGFWMSYLATFGLILASPYVSKLFANRTGYGKKPKLTALTVSLLKKLCSSFLITVTAVLSIIFLTQMYFGEISLVSPISNFLCGFAISVFFVLSLLLALFGGIPFAAKLLSPIAKFVGDYILNCVSRLSDLENVTLSLEKGYSYAIVFTFTAVMAVLLASKVKRKIFMVLPAIVCVIAFAVCMTVTGILTKDTAELLYLRRGEREVVVIVEDGDAAFVDVSDGNYSNYGSAWDKAHSMGATELDTFVVTHYHRKHVYSLSNLMSNIKVRRVLLPRPENKEEAAILSEIYRISSEHGTECGLYEREERVSVLSEIAFFLLPSELLDRSAQPTVAFGIEYGDGKLTYVGSSYFESVYGNAAEGYMVDSDVVIYGTHGPNPKLNYSVDSVKNAEEIVFADPELASLAYTSAGYPRSKNIVCDCEIRKFKIQRISE